MKRYRVKYRAIYDDPKGHQTMMDKKEYVNANDEKHLHFLVEYLAKNVGEDSGPLVSCEIQETESVAEELEEKCWTTADGLDIPYSVLTDDHLENIIKDGYRNKQLEEEAERRNFDYPARPVSQLKPREVFGWIESLSSCAIEGNELAEWVLEPREEDHELFLFRLNQLLELSNDSN